MSATLVVWCVVLLVWFCCFGFGLWLGVFVVVWWLSDLCSSPSYILDLSPLFTSMAQVILRMIQITGPTTLACKHIKAREKEACKKCVLSGMLMPSVSVLHGVWCPDFFPAQAYIPVMQMSGVVRKGHKWDTFLICAVLVTFERVTGELLHAVAAQVHVGWGEHMWCH